MAGFAQRAGFGNEVAMATALALAVSHGDDAYQWTYDVGRAVTDQQGLWGIDKMAYEEFADTDLFSPLANAKAALLLWRRGGGTWTWSPAWPPQTYRIWLPVATEAAEHPTYGQVIDGPGPSGPLTEYERSTAGAVDAALSMVDGAVRFLGQSH